MQCRFNNEILTTDPVSHSTAPIWDTELAWDVKPKTLSFLRSQRATLKLVCYSLDIDNEREPLGYVMLDLRAGAQGPPPYAEKWYPLFNTHNTSAFRPEIKLMFVVTNARDTLDALPHSPVRKPVPLKPVAIKLSSSPSLGLGLKIEMQTEKAEILKDINSTRIKVMLHKNGYYQVGNPEPSSRLFTWWISISFAEHLKCLLPETSSDAGYYFYYNLFGTDILTQKFYNLTSPDFPAERVSIRLKATAAGLKALFNELGNLAIHLCQDEQVVGMTDVSLTNISVQQATVALYLSEHVYALFGPKKEVRKTLRGDSPTIALSMALSADVDGANLVQISAISHEMMRTNSPKTAAVSATRNIEIPPLSHSNVNETIINENVYKKDTNTTNLEYSIRNLSSPAAQMPKAATETELNDALHHHPSSPKSQAWHQFRFSIELRSVRDCQIKTANVYFKYTYTPFGTSSPVITHPSTTIGRVQKETLLPHSFCAFEFVMSADQLERYIHGFPLKIEMWHKDENSRDVLLGHATVDLSLVLHSPKRDAHEKRPLVIQSLDTFSPVVAVTANHQNLLLLRIIMALEDFGPVEEMENPVLAPKTFEALHPRPTSNIPEPSIYPASYAASVADTSIHDTPEYRVAMELEIWRQEEQEKFQNSLLQKEQLMTGQLSQEWRARELEREKVLKRKLSDYKSLETQLETLALQLENREKSLEKAEAILMKRTLKLEQDTDRTVNEARDSSRRLAEEFKHKVVLEKSRTTEAESLRLAALRERKEAEEKYRQLDIEFSNFRKSLNQTSESTLQLDLAKSLAQNSSLERENQLTIEKLKQTKIKLAKVHKGYLLMKASAEREKERVQVNDKEAMQTFKQAMLVQGQLAHVKQDQEMLLLAKAQLQELGRSTQSAPDKENMSSANRAHLERLTNEKDSLLQTGIYDKGDSLIREIDSRISQLLN